MHLDYQKKTSSPPPPNHHNNPSLWLVVCGARFARGRVPNEHLAQPYPLSMAQSVVCMRTAYCVLKISSVVGAVHMRFLLQLPCTSISHSCLLRQHAPGHTTSINSNRYVDTARGQARCGSSRCRWHGAHLTSTIDHLTSTVVIAQSTRWPPEARVEQRMPRMPLMPLMPRRMVCLVTQ